MNVEVLEGELEGEIHKTVLVYNEDQANYTYVPRVGARIYVSPYNSSNHEGSTMKFSGNQNSFNRIPGLLIISIILAFLFILFARKQGFNTLLGLAISCLSIFFVFIPAILSG